MSTASYSIVFYDGYWRIKYLDLHLGEFASADSAVKAVMKVIKSRLASGQEVMIEKLPNGETIIGNPEGNA